MKNRLKKNKTFIQKRDEKGLEEFKAWLKANKSIAEQIRKELEEDE